MTFAGYHHINNEIWYNSPTNPKQLKVCDNSGEDSKCSDGVFGNSISDHLAYIGIST